MNLRNRIHVYQQLEHSDCGQTCIRILCHYYGLKLSPQYLRSIIEGSRQGMSIAEIRVVLGKLGFETAVVKAPHDKIIEAPLPCILYWNQNHFVVLYKISKNRQKFYIVDPAEGKRTILLENFKKSTCQNGNLGILILADPSPEFTTSIPDNTVRANASLGVLIKKWILSQHRMFAWIILLLLIGMGMDIALPFIFQHTVDEGISGGDINLIWILIFSQLLIFLGSSVTTGILELILTRIGLKIGIRMLNEYLNKLVRMPMDFFARKVNSDFLQKVEDHKRLSTFFTNLPQLVVFTIINLLIFGGILIWYSPLIFSIFLVFTLLGMLISSLFLRYRREVDYSLSSNYAENRNNLFELVQGVDEVKANNAHIVRVEVWNKVQKKINKLALRAATLNVFQNGGANLILQMRDLIITGICATLVVKGEMTFGIMMTVSYVAGRLSSPFNSVITSINTIQDASMSFNRIEEIQTTSPENCDNRISLETVGSISIDNLKFRYPGFGSPYVINDVSLEISVGEVTAIVGESGSGKSTILKLLLGFYDVDNGNIRINGIPIKEIQEESFLEKSAIVMQNGTLFSASIMHNIAIADEKPDIDRVVRAAKIAGIDEFIASLPMGYQTRIGKTGLELSGGQRQRIFIARAVYREPEILMLDEATSSLDAVSEATVMQNIFKHFKGRTVIVAAHRLSTIRNADKIIVMNQGRVVESGNHSTLMDANGHYRKLVEHQLIKTP